MSLFTLNQAWKMLITLSICALSLLLIPLTQAEVRGQFQTAEIRSIDSVGQGSLLFLPESNETGESPVYLPAPHLATDVNMTITGMINRTQITQTFHNTSSVWQEGIYVFPLPEKAGVDQLRMIIGERIIEGQIKEKIDAKRIYQQAKTAGKKAALSEQERPNIFTTSVANIAPNEIIQIEITYQETVSYDQGIFSLRFPMVVAPRYIPGSVAVRGFNGSGWASNTNEVPDAARITPPIKEEHDERENRVQIHVHLDPGFPLAHIESPYHPITENQHDQNRYQIQLQEGDTLANRDFELRWQAAASVTPHAALFTETHEDQNYALLMLVPPTQESTIKMKRDMIFVLDTSGSMAGDSILQAKSALSLALKRLTPNDHFNLIQFNSTTESLFTDTRPADQENITQALHYLEKLNADGGTEMYPALEQALTLSHESSKPNSLKQIIFLTDGSVGNETALFKLIENQLGQSRLFTIGIGSAPNSYFMQRAADYGRGTYTYIGKLSEVQNKLTAFFEKIESPVLKDIRLISDQDQTSSFEIWPRRISDLYRGEPLLVTLRTDDLPEKLMLSAKLADQPWEIALSLLGGQKQSGVHKLWARNKITGISTSDDDAETRKKSITETALKHHLVSQHTSLVAVDITPSRPINQNLQSDTIPGHLPHGWQREKLFTHPFPSTATDARLQLILGLSLLLASLIMFRRERHA